MPSICTHSSSNEEFALIRYRTKEDLICSVFSVSLSSVVAGRMQSVIFGEFLSVNLVSGNICCSQTLTNFAMFAAVVSRRRDIKGTAWPEFRPRLLFSLISFRALYRG